VRGFRRRDEGHPRQLLDLARLHLHVLLPTLLVTPVAYSLLAEAEARSGLALFTRVWTRLRSSRA